MAGEGRWVWPPGAMLPVGTDGSVSVVMRVSSTVELAERTKSTKGGRKARRRFGERDRIVHAMPSANGVCRRGKGKRMEHAVRKHVSIHRIDIAH